MDSFIIADQVTDMQVAVDGPAMPLKGLSSPITLLPADALLYLFHMGTFGSFDPYDAATFPLLVSQVCYQWRQLALHTSTLWTTIAVNEISPLFYLPVPELPGLDIWAPQRAFPRAGLFIERSGTRPLSVYLDLRGPGEELCLPECEFDSVFNPFFCDLLGTFLASHTRRFKEFTLFSSTFPPIANVLARLSYLPMPLLEKWDLHRCNVYHSFQDSFYPRELKDSLGMLLHPRAQADISFDDYGRFMYPNIKHAVLAGVPFDWARFSLTNLTSLTINHLANEVRPDYKSLRHVLLSNRLLEVLEIQGAAPLDTGEPYELSNLHTLTIGYTFPSEALGLIQTLRMPKITTLVVGDLNRQLTPGDFDRVRMGDDQNATALFSAMLQFIPGELKGLIHLTLQSVAFCPDHLPLPLMSPLSSDSYELPVPLGFFRTLVSLKHLSLHDPDRAVMRALNFPIPTHDSADSCSFSLPTPSLTHFHICELDMPTVRMFLHARAQLVRLPPHTCIVPILEELTIGLGFAEDVASLCGELRLVARRIQVVYNQIVDDVIDVDVDVLERMV